MRRDLLDILEDPVPLPLNHCYSHYLVQMGPKETPIEYAPQSSRTQL